MSQQSTTRTWAPQPGTLGFHIMKLPTEIRLQIFAEVCAPYKLPCGFDVSPWGNWPAWRWYPDEHQIPKEILSQGVPAYYNSKKLTIELPAFVPSLAENRESIRWPKALYMHDEDNEFCLELVTSILSEERIVIHGPKEVSLPSLMECPFYLFSGITIKIPSHQDSLHLIINWCRLRVLGYILEEMKSRCERMSYRRLFECSNRLPPINIVFSDEKSFSWFEENGNLKCTLGHLQDPIPNDDAGPISDVLLLIRALSPIKGNASIQIHTPNGVREEELRRYFSVAWLLDTHIPLDDYDSTIKYCDEISKILKWLSYCETTMAKRLDNMGILTIDMPITDPEEWGDRDVTIRTLPYLGQKKEFIKLVMRTTERSVGSQAADNAR